MQNFNDYETLDINEITLENGFVPIEWTERLEEMGYKSDTEDFYDMARALTKQQYEYYAKERKNLSPEADKLMNEMKKGHLLTEDETFFLLSDQKWLDEHEEVLQQKKEIDQIKKRVSKGQISYADFDRLAELIGFDKDIKDRIITEFNLKGLLVSEYDKEKNDKIV